jgi:hypothetical protein
MDAAPLQILDGRFGNQLVAEISETEVTGEKNVVLSAAPEERHQSNISDMTRDIGPPP